MCDQQKLRSACAYAQSDQNLCLSLEYSMNIKLLSERHLEFLSLTGGCTGSPESTHVKMPYCWKSHVTAYMRMIGQMEKSAFYMHHKLLTSGFSNISRFRVKELKVLYRNANWTRKRTCESVLTKTKFGRQWCEKRQYIEADKRVN